MPNVDSALLDEVMSECEGVERSMLELAIFHINAEYARLMRRDDAEAIDFEAIMEEALEHCSLRNLFEYKPYKHALGKYYSKRKAAAALERKEKEEVIGEVRNPSDQAVTIRASYEVEIRFKALKESGKLEFLDVDKGEERKVLHGNSQYVSEDLYLRAKRQALAIMNSRRK